MLDVVESDINLYSDVAALSLDGNLFSFRDI